MKPSYKVDMKTSQRMSNIKGKNTKPELLIRSALHKKGFRYSLHNSKLPGKPDIVLTKHKTIINVNGCFWHNHNCDYGRIPRNNRKFWMEKFKKNKKRDKINLLKLRKLGWKVYNVWECKLDNKQLITLQNKLFNH